MVFSDRHFDPLTLHNHTVGVYVSGILAAISCACLGLFCILSIVQIAMISSREKVVMKYKPLVIVKLILAVAAGEFQLMTAAVMRVDDHDDGFCVLMSAALLAIACAILFAVYMDGPQRSFSVTRGISFYLQVGSPKHILYVADICVRLIYACVIWIMNSISFRSIHAMHARRSPDRRHRANGRAADHGRVRCAVRFSRGRRSHRTGGDLVGTGDHVQ